jgi:hypothetical protein
MVDATATPTERALVELDGIIVAISARTIVPSGEVVDMLLDLRQVLDPFDVDLVTEPL